MPRVQEPGQMRRLVSMLLLSTLATAQGPELEAPQIWTLQGVSLSFQRAEIERRLGQPMSDRPLKASWGGERWEYSYRGGLRAAFVDQDRGRHPRLLVGTDWRSRGQVMVKAGCPQEKVRELLGAPQFENDDSWVYWDESRKAYLTLFFEGGKVQEFCLSRFRIDSSR